MSGCGFGGGTESVGRDADGKCGCLLLCAGESQLVAGESGGWR